MRGLIDFLYDRPNVAVVFLFLARRQPALPLEGKAGRRQGESQIQRTRRGCYTVGVFRRAIPKGARRRNSPETAAGPGSIAEWSYFHYGRWSLSARAWWVPKAEGKSEEKRGADELNALRWFDQEKVAGFVNWQPIEHPGLSGQEVEIGGFKPFFRLNPPAGELDGLAQKHLEFLLQLPGLLPQIDVVDAKASDSAAEW